MRTSMLVVSLSAFLFMACGSKKISDVSGAPHLFDAVCGTDVDGVNVIVYEGKGLLRGLFSKAVALRCERSGNSGKFLICESDAASLEKVKVEFFGEAGSASKAVIFSNGVQKSLSCQ